MRFLHISFQFSKSSLWQWHNNTLWNPPEQPDVGLLLAKQNNELLHSQAGNE